MITVWIIQLINWKKLFTGQKSAVLILLCSYIFFLNAQNMIFFRTSKAQGMATIDFLKFADMKLKENTKGSHAPQSLTLKRGGRWDIKINISHGREHIN